MQFIKSIGDGIGTAAGVAWPTFGIIFGTLSLTTAGATAIFLGAFSFGLFLIVAIPISVYSYRNYQEERKALEDQEQREMRAIGEYLFNYLFTVIRECISENKTLFFTRNRNTLYENVKAKIFNDLIQNNDMLSKSVAKTLVDILDDKNTFLRNFTDDVINKSLIKFDEQISTKISKPQIKTAESELGKIFRKNKAEMDIKCPPKVNSSYIKAGLAGFCAAFGTIAGCGAGTMGMLAGIGVFAGLATIPIIGWATLAGALVFGITVASICAYYTYQHDKNLQGLKDLSDDNNKFERLVHTKYVVLEADIAARNKYTKKSQKTYSQTNERVYVRPANLNQNNLVNLVNPLWRKTSTRDQLDGLDLAANEPANKSPNTKHYRARRSHR